MTRIIEYRKWWKDISKCMSIDTANRFVKDLCDYAEMLERKTPTAGVFCCDDLKITVEDYKHITIKGTTIRFSGHEIYYCPYCGTKLRVE